MTPFKPYDTHWNADKFGKRLTMLRREYCVTHNEKNTMTDFYNNHLQDEIGFDAYKNWERGEAFPRSVDKLFMLCNLFECDIDYLLGRQSMKHKRPADIHDATGLNDEAIKVLTDEVFSDPGTRDFANLINAEAETQSFRIALYELENHALGGISSNFIFLDAQTFDLLPEELQDLVLSNLELDLYHGGGLNRSGLLEGIAERASDEDVRHKLLKKCKTIEENPKYIDVHKELLANQVQLPEKKELESWYYNLVTQAHDSGAEIPFTKDVLLEEIFVIYTVTFVCAHDEALLMKSDAVVRYSITRAFSDVIDRFFNIVYKEVHKEKENQENT